MGAGAAVVAKSQVAFARAGRGCIKPHRLLWRVMRQELAGRCQGVVDVAARQGLAQHRLDLLGGEATGAQQHRRLPCEAHNGGFHANRAGAIRNQSRNAPGKPRQDVIRCCRADPPGRIGRGRRHRPVQLRQQFLRRWMGRHPQGQSVQPRCHQLGNAMIRGQWQHQRQGPRPEGAGQAGGPGVPDDVTFCCLNRGDMGNQRIETGASLGSIDRRHRIAAPGIGPQPIDRLCWERDQISLPQQLCRTGNPAG